MKGTIHFLFSYGTLQYEKVQLENYGRILTGTQDRLTGYKMDKIKITDSTVLAKSQLEYHPIALKSENDSDYIDGVLFEITGAELAETDKYEVSQYQRIVETFQSGKKGWVYVAKNIRK